MGFNKQWGWVVAVTSLLISLPAAGQADKAHITVVVCNSAGVSSGMLRLAESEASMIFRTAGIEITWMDWSDWRGLFTEKQYMLHIVHDGKTRSPLVFGEAFLGENESGTYADIFFDRIGATNYGYGDETARLLGYVAAHELGHLLLGSHSHSTFGIMSSVWNRDSLKMIEVGILVFTKEESVKMRHRLARDRGAIVAAGLPLAEAGARPRRLPGFLP